MKNNVVIAISAFLFFLTISCQSKKETTPETAIEKADINAYFQTYYEYLRSEL